MRSRSPAAFLGVFGSKNSNAKQGNLTGRK